jgi:cobalt-zinc-cadmium efflux system membrane fusion protein
MNKSMNMLLSVAAVAAGVALTIVAHRQGWLSGNPDSATLREPAPLNSAEPDHSGHQHDSPVISLIAATTDLPRARRTPSVDCATTQSVVQFANSDIARQAGLVTETVRRRPVSHVLTCNAELAFDGNRVAHLSPRASGSVQEVRAQVGDNVRAGDVLALVDSLQLAEARAGLLQARAVERLRRKNFERQVVLSESGVTARRELLDAETSLAEATIALSAARQRLANLGLNEAQIDRLASDQLDGDPSMPNASQSEMLAVVAPFNGVVVERHAVLGERVDPSQSLFTIADTTRMWALLDVYESEARFVRVGQPVVVSVQALPGETFAGTVTWVAPSLDPRTRTIKARAEIDNTGGLLKANMFGQARITVRDRTDEVTVPKSAVQWEGCCNVVFVKHSDTVFQPYRVRLGMETDDAYVVEDGLPEGEQIVTQGSYLLKTEILKGSIGAGCCEVHGVTDASED